MATTLTYNDITLSNVLTRRFEETCVYDESGTDILYHQFRIKVLGYVHSNSASFARVNVSTNASGKHACTSQIAMRTALMEARKKFIFTVGGMVLLVVNPAPADGSPSSTVAGSNDVNNGPKPQNCNIVHIAGSAVFRVEFEIELAIVECADNKNTLGILNNRWSMGDVIDENFYTTRTINGRLRTAAITINPQAFRTIVIPPLQSGFRRQSISMITSPDGMTLEYTVVDQEMYAAPPYPATTWEGFHTVSSEDGINSHAELNIRLTAAKDTPKDWLIDIACQIATSKLYLDGKTPVLQGAAIVDHLHENVIELRVNTLQTPGPSLYEFGFNVLGLGKHLTTPDYKKDEWPLPKAYGSATITGLFISYLQSPCNDKHGVPQATGSPSAESQGSRKEVEIFTYEGTVPNTRDTDVNYSDPHKTYPYTYYRIDSIFRTNNQKVQLPIAAASNAQDTDSAAIITLARPTTQRIVHVEAERHGAQPDIPAPVQTADLGDGVIATLLSSDINAKAPQLTANASTFLFSIDVEYVYALSKPVSALSKIPTGALPYGSAPLSQTALAPSSLVTGLV